MATAPPPRADAPGGAVDQLAPPTAAGAGGPRGSGTRSAQALALVQAKPGITIPDMGKEMGITPNYLYRVLPELAKNGKVKRTARAGNPPPSNGVAAGTF